jgi:hypothetical protein
MLARTNFGAHPFGSSTRRSSAGSRAACTAAAIPDGARVKVTTSVKVFHSPKFADGLDLQGHEGTVKMDVTQYKGKVLSANLQYRVEFSVDKDGAPVKVLAHLVSPPSVARRLPSGRRHAAVAAVERERARSLTGRERCSAQTCRRRQLPAHPAACRMSCFKQARALPRRAGRRGAPGLVIAAAARPATRGDELSWWRAATGTAGRCCGGATWRGRGPREQ